MAKFTFDDRHTLRYAYVFSVNGVSCVTLISILSVIMPLKMLSVGSVSEIISPVLLLSDNTPSQSV